MIHPWFDDPVLQDRLNWDVLFEEAFKAPECTCAECIAHRGLHLTIDTGEIEYITPPRDA